MTDVAQIEQGTLFVIYYYDNMQENTAPEIYYPLLRDYNAALAFANAKIAAESGVGCCFIQQISGTFVFTPHTLEAFNV